MMNNNIDLRAFNEVRDLKKDFNDSLIKKRFREKSKSFKFEGNGGLDAIKTLSFEGLTGSLLNLRIYLKLNSSQNFYVKFNSIIVYKAAVSEDFNFELDLELEKNNTLEFYSDGDVFVDAKLKGNIDIQDLDNVDIIKLTQTYYVATDFNGKIYFHNYTFFDSFAENFNLTGGSVKENFVDYSNLIEKINGLVFNYTLAVLTGNSENGFILTQSDEAFSINHEISYPYKNGSLLPILSNYYRFGIVSFDGTSFFINYYDANFVNQKEVQINFGLKYEIRNVGGFDYFDETEFSYHGFWFVDKNNDAYLVLSKDASAEELAFHNAPVYLGKASRIKVYSKGNEFVIFLSYDNAVTKIVLNITHDNYSLNANRLSKTIVKNVDFGFLDKEEDYYYSNGCITKLT